MATEAAPEQGQGCHAASPCPAGEGLDAPGKGPRMGQGAVAPVVTHEREAEQPEPWGTSGQEEVPAHGQSPGTCREEGSRVEHGGAPSAPLAQLEPAEPSGQPGRGGEGSRGDPPSAAPAPEPPGAADGEPRLSTELGQEEAPGPHGGESPATSPPPEQPAEERADSQPDGEQRGLERRGPDASGAPVPGEPLLAVGPLAPCIQQGAAGAGQATAVPRSPLATGDSSGPAHLACDCSREPGGGESPREGPAGSEAGGTGNNNKPRGEVGAGTLLESEPGEVPVGSAGPRETSPGADGAGEPDGAVGPVGAQEAAGAPDPTGADPAGPCDLGSTTEPAPAPASAGDPAGASDPGAAAEGSMENGDLSSEGEAPKPGGETPIEREIRRHQEREDSLRRQRGLASPRGAQEYVELRVKPILSHAPPPSQLPKEKERQWAGLQMQREIQRERLREDDLVQLGKVRGAYDRGTPQQLQEKKLLFEQPPGPEPSSPRKPARGSRGSSGERPPGRGPRGPSFAEANSQATVVILEPGALLHPSPGRQHPPERSPPAPGSPFLRLRSRSPQSRLALEMQEAQDREQELQRQRHNLYGWALPRDAQGAADGEEPPPHRPERPSCGKLEVTWPPPDSSKIPPKNRLDQVQRSPRSLRQKSALIQRWESGVVCNHEGQE
ncbi:uncharacterized protein MISP3 [Carettochelys insculpta]|uniref:uncharacterized protein MISP3 n=1 Tax=Carettochelys insculpta TaxID=44489 RepID=UPI003EBBD6B2